MYPNLPPNQPPYPNQQIPPAGYPPQAGMPVYPTQTMPGAMPGYPAQNMPQTMPQTMPGYPAAGPMPGYPPQQFGAMPGYPPQQDMSGYQQNYPPQTTVPGYPSHQQYQPPAGNYYQQPMMQQQQAIPQQPPMQQQQQVAPQQQPITQHQPIPQQQVVAAFGQSSVQPQGRPTVVPVANFNASNDAAALRKAMKGFGTDEDVIIDVLCRRSNSQRLEIVKAFKTAYGKDLIDDIQSECRNNFLTLLMALLMPTYEFYARELYEAMYGEGTDEDVLTEVMCGLPNRDIRAINSVYSQIFGKTLEQALREDTSGCFKRIMVSLSTGNRDESMVVDPNAARIDAQALRNAGVRRTGTDESEFNRILCLRNYAQIKLIAQEYEKLTGNTLEKDIKKEFSGDIEDALVSVLRVALNRSEFFAKRLYKAMAGLGTNDRDLIRLVVTRCEIDMVDIKEEFQKKYGKSLKSFIKGDTSGDYKHALYALIGESRS